MKTGVIVYVAGTHEVERHFDFEEGVRNLGIRADRLEVVTPGESGFDVMDAWWLLTAKGMKRIICMVAEVAGTSGIRLTGRELRLCG